VTAERGIGAGIGPWSLARNGSVLLVNDGS